MRFVNRQFVYPDYQNTVGIGSHRGLHVHRRGQRDISFKIAVWNFRLALARVMQKLNRLADTSDFNFFPVYLNMHLFLIKSRHIREHNDLLNGFVHINIGTPDAFVIFEGRTHQMKHFINRSLKLIFKITTEFNFYVSHFRRLLDQFY
jgi:hypothetical protein